MFLSYMSILCSSISINFVVAGERDTLFKKQSPILLLGISSFNFTLYTMPFSKYSFENSLITQAIPKFALANSNNKS